MSSVEAYIAEIIRDSSPQDHFEGCTDEEIEAIRLDQGVSRLPVDYAHFLRRVGRHAGLLLRGTDAFYPELLGIKTAAQVLLAENGLSNFLGTESLVIGMHQGYQIFWFPDVLADNPPVLMYQEGDQQSTMSWRSFIEYLIDVHPHRPPD